MNPCELRNTCGRGAVCSVSDHKTSCRCPANTRGDPKVGCKRIQCLENHECSQSQSCIDNKCIDPCSLPNTCGQSAQCISENHVALCACHPGTTGNPLLGCIPLEYCSVDHQCSAGAQCNNGICSSICSSSRDCLEDQLCLQGVCQPTCKSNSTCPDFQFCLNNICVQEPRCLSDNDCDIEENCVTDNNGRSECKKVCGARFLCSRNAECIARNHQPECQCKQGFYSDGKVCRKIDCNSDSDCSSDKLCDNHVCKMVCLLGDPCGQHALCSAENHKQVCYCQPGYSGDPRVECKALDFCSQNPCGQGASCKNSRGSFKCSCPQGMVGDPFTTGCLKAVECQINDHCPNTAKCVQENGVPKCKDVCEGAACGPNSGGFLYKEFHLMIVDRLWNLN